MMANHRPLALTLFDPTHIAQCMHVHIHVVHTCTCTVFVHVYMYMYSISTYMYMYIARSEQLLGQPITNENTSFIFEFGILALMSSALNFDMYRRIKARRRMVTVRMCTVKCTTVCTCTCTCRYTLSKNINMKWATLNELISNGQ